MSIQPYKPKNKIRIVTAASLFDGHDAAINIMRRIMQSSGAEIIHLGHNRSVEEIVTTAIQEDVQGIAITSYQGGHIEFFKYTYDLLKERGASQIKIFGGGGGTILPHEIEELHAYGIARLYSPDDGRRMGLQGMINDVLAQCDFPVGQNINGEVKKLSAKDPFSIGVPSDSIARLISAVENFPEQNEGWLIELRASLQTPNPQHQTPIIGITGTGGAGKSSLVDELVRRFLMDFDEKTVAIVSVDPSKRKTGGALLGDRIRMNAINNGRIFMRSLATRQSNLALSKYVQSAVDILRGANFDLIILETSGIGQSDTEIVDHSDVSLYVMTPEYGAATQLEKIDMLDFADLIAINKFDKRGAQDALRDVKKQYQRNHNLWDAPTDEMPVFGTMASQFNDAGMNELYAHLLEKIKEKTTVDFVAHSKLASRNAVLTTHKTFIIPPNRTRYLSEITENNRNYDKWVAKQVDVARQLFSVKNTIQSLENQNFIENKEDILRGVKKLYEEVELQLDGQCKRIIENWEAKYAAYRADEFVYQVRGKDIKVPIYRKTLSGNKIPRVILPKFKDWGEILRWSLQENVPGEFPYTAGVFPFKREGEDPTRMFAGEGNPERTNRRFHYVSKGLPAKRLSTAFDSVTLYGEDPDFRPDIYGKVGNSGVNICCLDDMKKLYSGFNLTDPKTSVSMTINGPAAIMTAFFMNAVIDQECEKYVTARDGEVSNFAVSNAIYLGDLPEGNDGLGLKLLGTTGDTILDPSVYNDLKNKALTQVRGTVQADILKEDQAQNTCIFSTEFSLRLMGDMQEYFIKNKVRNFYSVSISGYHIAEAGANPISQLAFTLSNGFTFVEYYLSRGMNIDDFAPNLSFFFSNGVDPEYAVIGRVARRIWAKAMKHKYGANERSQQLKYHIQTSGRSLHAQEIAFNDIRTTLQALYAIYDNCNSLHTNAYDEAITTPTEESVRRAMAIQMIINHELGLAKNENPMQGSFIIEELTDLVEEAVLMEFDRINERGGVLGAMETMYQRSKVQEESMHYEMLKHTGELPIIGVNTFLNTEGSPTVLPKEVIRSTEEEKRAQIATRDAVQTRNPEKSAEMLRHLQQVALENGNIFEELMETAKFCTLGQITHALYEVGGQYRRNM
ncbi:MAG: methylmalonyl-CoA mutase family protein [Saprospiraceae bacterium]|nr:methylmalonyl-CoA mutase family protein [Saprospiraceae bacterium]